MQDISLLLCRDICVKIEYDNDLSEAIIFFCDGFNSPIDTLCGHTIEITINRENIEGVTPTQLYRNVCNGNYECGLSYSKAFFDKKCKNSKIDIHILDLLYASKEGYRYNVLFYLLTEIMTRILFGKGLRAFHASAISKNGKAVLFMGESMVGKTTLSILLSQRGYDYLGDDRVFVKDSCVYAYPKPLHLSVDVMHLFEENSNRVERKRKGKMFVPVRKYIDSAIVENSDIKCVFLLSKAKGESDIYISTDVRNNSGMLYGLNSNFYALEELPMLLDAILQIGLFPLYRIECDYGPEYIDELYGLVSGLLD